MSRHFVAFVILAVTGALLLPDTSWAAAGGLRAGGATAGRFLRTPFIVHRNARAGVLRPGREGVAMPRFGHTRPAAHVRIPPAATGAFSTSRLVRLNHRGYINGWVLPITSGGDSAYIGTPYDPADAIPVYAPPVYAPPFAEDTEAPVQRSLLPRLTNAREETATPDACRSERVTVPASEGEREILVVRC